MSTVRYVLEFGMGVDLHGQDCTKAACRAVFDAVRHSSLPLLHEIEERGGTMLVEVTVGVPDPAAVDVEVVKRELPHGEVSVQAVSGGLRVPGSETLIACAAVVVSARYPEPS
ncbi:MAG TPA: Lin0512 family protein [Chloroflexota bacterium]|nr:Lin0512 family protein [Chloroflexota bacterium]